MMRMSGLTRSRVAVATVAAGVLLATAACGGGGESSAVDNSKRPSDPALAKLFDAAIAEVKDSGELNIYTGMQDTVSAKLGKDYTKRFGLPAKVENIAGTEITERYVTEAKTGKPSDVIMLGSCGFIEQQVADGVVTSFDKAELPGFPADTWPANFTWAGSIPVLQYNLWGIGYNTSMLSEDKAPKSWEDLLDPKWKGKLLLVGPETSSGMAGAWDWLIREKGEGFVKKLAAQAGVWGAGTQPASQQLAAGELPIMVPTAQTVMTTVRDAGGPTDFVPIDETTGAPMCAGISAKAAHPAQAKLFLANLLTADGNNEFSAIKDNGTVGPFGGSLEFPSKFSQEQTLTPERTAEIVKIVKG
jgi:iron(III) transport system substrate-binding protein